jgi:hypothetical protein
MKGEDTDRQLSERLREQLRAGEDSIDELTAARLQAARRQALAAVGRHTDRSRYAWTAGGFATAAVAVLAIVLWSGGEVSVPAMFADDWELLAEGDLQLIEDLEFYDWLPEEETAG